MSRKLLLALASRVLPTTTTTTTRPWLDKTIDFTLGGFRHWDVEILAKMLHYLMEDFIWNVVLLFCFNPASIFFSAAYSESLFCLLTFYNNARVLYGNTFYVSSLALALNINWPDLMRVLFYVSEKQVVLAGQRLATFHCVISF
ncbi:GPI mannosyltransferase 2 [Lucilia cuprina]|nr:GPI mannosyltransferase 2 [Lucilia cuprina]